MSKIFDILKEPAPVINQRGAKSWYNKAGKLHRENDQPALIYPDGTELWYKDGLLHRENDKPAVIASDGTKVWYLNDKCHRVGGRPAVINTDGTRYWWIDGIQVKNPE